MSIRNINIALDDRRVQRALTETLQAGRDLPPAMRGVGELLLNGTRERFDTQESPDGLFPRARKNALQPIVLP